MFQIHITPSIMQIKKFNFGLQVVHLSLIMSSRMTIYRVFFIVGQIRINCKMLKISLVGFGLRTGVTLGNLISDQFETHF